MSFYRSLVVAVATLGLATVVFAADQDTSNTQGTNDNSGTQQQAADTNNDANATSNTDTNSTNTTATSSENNTQATDKINLNTATIKQLTAVKGMTISKAKAIISYRKKHNGFKSLDELKEVRGFKKINDEALKNIEDQLTIG